MDWSDLNTNASNWRRARETASEQDTNESKDLVVLSSRFPKIAGNGKLLWCWRDDRIVFAHSSVIFVIQNSHANVLIIRLPHWCNSHHEITAIVAHSIKLAPSSWTARLTGTFGASLYRRRLMRNTVNLPKQTFLSKDAYIFATYFMRLFRS